MDCLLFNHRGSPDRMNEARQCSALRELLCFMVQTAFFRPCKPCLHEVSLGCSDVDEHLMNNTICIALGKDI